MKIGTRKQAQHCLKYIVCLSPPGKNQDLQSCLEGQIDRLIQWTNITQKKNSLATHINMDGLHKHNIEEKEQVTSIQKIGSFEVFFFLTSLNYTGYGCMANKTTRKIKGMIIIIEETRRRWFSRCTEKTSQVLRMLIQYEIKLYIKENVLYLI